ncbi:MAG: dTDP-glucose 4,6-dehydratase [Candidatus Omnitrophica bacterium]|nr:dTDP-glucose 4,6-dehydratase [Candidatus Omnitrophota bacterium]MDD5553393.1 dTDP-glucose 4,6-dehydratase [Candidatus Omnitrophota bacterium]
MRKRIHKILVTGGAGFIGSEFVRQASKARWGRVIVVDKLTYAGDLKRLDEVRKKHDFHKIDICDEKRMDAVFKKERPQVVVNFAAETHVDRSILDAKAFLRTNIMGTQVLLDKARKYGVERFVHISTDETFGDIKKGKFSEDSPLKPNSPYAASKAAADLIIKSYMRTYAFPAVIVRPSNNYGPWQFPEKLIPVIINHALRDKKVPVYAEGLNVREWLYVSDCARAVMFLLREAKAGQIYNLGSGHHEKNIDVVKQILTILRKPFTLIEFVDDRPGHDWRYALDSSKVRNLGWRPEVSFSRGLEMTVAWNIANRKWLMDKGRK